MRRVKSGRFLTLENRSKVQGQTPRTGGAAAPLRRHSFSMALRRILSTALAAAAVAAVGVAPASAAIPVTGSALAEVRVAVESFVAPVAPEYVEGLRTRRAAISTRDARFAAAWIEMPYAGRQVAYLRRGPRGWRVLDIGPARVGCGLLPNAVLVDLGGRCPQGI